MRSNLFPPVGGSLTLAMLAAMIGLAGCAAHPIRALVGGNMGVDGDIAMTGEVTTINKTSNAASPVRPIVVSGDPHCGGRIAVIDVDGLIVDQPLSGLGSLGENPVALFKEKIRCVERDRSIVGVVLRINSPGGGVTASEIMANEVARLKQRRDIPVVACLMTTGTGGGYLLATHADTIIAHPTSIVGGIGVILNTYNMEDTLAQFNVISIPVKAGKKIDTGSPQRVMREEERELLQSIADQFHQRFIDHVNATRGEVRPISDKLFDGRVMTGAAALQDGLVDQTGFLEDAIDRARSMAGTGPDAAVLLMRRDNDRALSEFDVTPNRPMSSLLPIQIPGLDRSSMPTFLYLWQADPSIVTAAGA